jgi:hypothetical protein
MGCAAFNFEVRNVFIVQDQSEEQEGLLKAPLRKRFQQKH